MKNREEINKILIANRISPYHLINKAIDEILDQQNKQLLDEIDLVNTVNVKLNDNNIKLLEEINRLKAKLKEDTDDFVKALNQRDDEYNQLQSELKDRNN